MAKLEFNCAATMIGSVPWKDAAAALDRVERYLRDLPAWPQLPMRSNLENMYTQFSQGFPGIQVDGEKLTVRQDAGFDVALDRIFSDSYENNPDGYTVGPDYAAGLHCLVAHPPASPRLKGQETGPISWGLCVTDGSGKGIIYDDTLADALAAFLRLKVSWQERLLRTVAQETVIFLDEPYLASLGSAFVSLSADKVFSLIAEVLSGIEGIKGVHCCGGTDWSLLLKLPADVISFDAYNYLDSFYTYQPDVLSYIKNGGGIAWGIVPNDEEALKKESLSSLYDRFGEALAPLTRYGLSIREVAAASLITPTCGLASLPPDAAEQVLELLGQLSEKARRKYG